jgi:hypothetical protein
MKIFWISSPFLFLVTATMLVGGRDCRTQFWKGITYGPFHQSLVSSGQVVSEENCVRKSWHPTNMATVAKNRKGGWNFNCFPLKLLGRLDSSFAKIMLWWSPFKIIYNIDQGSNFRVSEQNSQSVHAQVDTPSGGLGVDFEMSCN